MDGQIEQEAFNVVHKANWLGTTVAVKDLIVKQ